MTATPDIFLSYNREDQATAHRFAEAFERQGFKVWWDATLRSGEAYDEVTETALRTAKAVVVLWSKKSVVSRWVRAEATLADRNKTLVPAMIEPCDRPIMFELTQTADLSQWTGDADHPAWRAYVADVRRFVDRGEPGSTAAQVSARAAGQTFTAASIQAPTQTASQSLLAATRPAPDRGGEPNVVVLPITSRSGLPGDEAFAADLTSELIAELTRHGWARVITAATPDRNSAVDLCALARGLDARYVVEAHARRIGATFRLMVQLLEAQNGNIIWTQRYDRPLESLVGLEESLAVEVASHVGEDQILRREMERAEKKSGGWSAWERALRSLASAAHLNSDSVRTSIQEAQQACLIAPDYALAHALLAWALGNSMYFSGGGATGHEVRTCIKRALDLDSGDPRVLRLVSMASTSIGDPDTGLRFAKRAIELAPHIGNGYNCLALADLLLGRNAEAIAALEAGQKLSPQVFDLYASLCLRALAHFSDGRLQEAREALDRSLELNANYIPTQKWRVIVSGLLGEQEAARRSLRDMRVTEPSLTLEDHASQITRALPNSARVAEAVVALRKTWAEVELTP